MGNEDIKYFYQGDKHDFIIFVESEDLVKKFKKGDTTIPLIEMVSIYKIFSNRAGGVEGILEEASRSDLSNEFDTTDTDEVIKKILKNGSSRQGKGLTKGSWTSTNDSRGVVG